MLLAGDIGGTKTVLALFSADSDLHTPTIEKRYPSAQYNTLEDIILEFLEEFPHEIEAAAFGVAGPVIDGVARITNLSWIIDEMRLAAICRIPKVALLNDLTATANAIPVLHDDDIYELRPGTPRPGGTIAVIAPGTGLGEAYLTWDGDRYHAHPSEGGHANFSPSNKRELALLNYLFPKFGNHVSTERVCSGSGMPNIYDFLKHNDHAVESAEIAAALAAADDPTPVIVENALSDNPDLLCLDTLQMFISILGAEAGDLALSWLSTGGVYLGGGVPVHILSALDSPHFHNSFTSKGRFAGMVAEIPVNVITNPKAALFGAARAGRELLKSQ